MASTSQDTRATTSGRAPDSRPGLVAYVVILFAIPAELVVSPLGAAGSPAQILGLLLFAWWLGQRLLHGSPQGASRRILLILAIFAASIVMSYAVGMLRPVTPAELNSADRGLLSLFAWLGIALSAADGLRTRASLDRVLMALGLAGGTLALLGIIQFFTGLDISRLYSIPGLTPNGDFGQLLARSAFFRVSGTATHPIEFGVVLMIALAICLHYVFWVQGRIRTWLWLSVAAIAIAVPLSVARSALLGAVIVLAFLVPTWSRRVQLRAIVTIVLATVVMGVLVPGLVGTLRGLVLNAGSDPSTQGRIDDYAPIIDYFQQSPWFGRGAFTFLPSIYRTLDNQYLGTLVEGGVLGLAGLVLLFAGSVLVAFRIRRLSPDPATRSLALSMAAAITVAAVTYFTFDGLGFPMCTGVLFLVIGAIGALDRLRVGEADAAHVGAMVEGAPASAARRWAPDALACGVVVLLLLSLGTIVRAAPTIDGSDTLLLQSPPPYGGNVFLARGNTDLATAIMRDLFDDQSTRDAVIAAGGPGDYGVAVGDGSVARGTDVHGSGSTIRLVVNEPTIDDARAALTRIEKVFATMTADLQAKVGLTTEASLALAPLPVGPQFAIATTSPKRAALGVLLVGAISLAWLLPRTRVMALWRGRSRRSGAHAGQPAEEPAPVSAPTG